MGTDRSEKMKKTHLLPALLSLLGTSWAVTKKPSDIKLKWLEDEVIDGDTLPHMEITFADGTTDEIFLKPDLENACFYHGTLKSDIESEVEVDGCRGELRLSRSQADSSPAALSFSSLRTARPTRSTHLKESRSQTPRIQSPQQQRDSTEPLLGKEPFQQLQW